jgi:hypothetical protein
MKQHSSRSHPARRKTSEISVKKTFAERERIATQASGIMLAQPAPSHL